MTIENVFEWACPSTLEQMFGEPGTNVKAAIAQASHRQAEILTGDKIASGTFNSGSDGFLRTVTSPFVPPCAECGNAPRLMRIARNNKIGRAGDWLLTCSCGESSGYHSQPILAVREWSKRQTAMAKKRKVRAK